MRKLLIISSIIALSACSSQARYVVYRDVPESPTFTVMGLTWDKDDAEYARELEPILLSFGLRVITPPAPKRVETTNGGAKGDVSATASGNDLRASGRSSGATVTETYNNVMEANSTHIVTADWKTSSIRVIEKSSGQVLAAQSLSGKRSFGSDSTRDILSGVLKNLGFKVRDEE